MKSYLKLLFPLLIIVGTVTSFGVQVSNAQQVQRQAVYIQESQDTQSIVSIPSGTVLTLPQSYCVYPSPDLHYVAAVDRDNKTALYVYDLTGATKTLETPWRADWTWACKIEWLDSRTVAVITTWENGYIYKIDAIAGTVADPIPYQPSITLDKQDPRSFIVVKSPATHDVVYRYCFGNIVPAAVGKVCDGSTSFVIYSQNQQQVVAQLEDYYVPIELNPMPPEYFFSWSPSGGYLAQSSINQLIDIFDRSTNSYLDLSFLPQNLQLIVMDPRFSWQWSPDERRVAFWVHGLTRLGYSGTDGGIAVVDFVDRSIQLIQIPDADAPREGVSDWAWNLNADGFLILTENHQLVEITADGFKSEIADHVKSLFVSLNTGGKAVLH